MSLIAQVHRLNSEARRLNSQIEQAEQLLESGRKRVLDLSQYANVLRERAERAEARIANATMLHYPVPDGWCAGCGKSSPCPTIRALDGTPPEND